jgi:hypothetical protein
MARELTRHTWRASLTGGATQPQVFILYQKLGRNVDEKRWTRRSDKKKGERELLVAISLCREWFAVRLLLHASLLT